MSTLTGQSNERPPAESSVGALTEERREALEEIDASWCPRWPVAWQRAFHLTRLHLETGHLLPTEPGQVSVQGEDLGKWVRAQSFQWDQLSTVQQWMCEQVLAITPAAEASKPKPRVTQAEKWAARRCPAVLRARTPPPYPPPARRDRGYIEYKTGAWVANAGSRAAKLAPERVAELSAIGMRWV
ncbi:helicase associated domain-containing protein [Streptomyces flavidovirens]